MNIPKHEAHAPLHRIVVAKNDHIVFRPQTVELAEIVSRYSLTLVVGEPGVGKTTLLRLVADYVGNPSPANVSSIPRTLLGRTFFRTSVVELQAGASYVNELEGRVLRVASLVRHGDEEADIPGGGVLCIEDVHLAGTAGATGTDPAGTVANILVPLVAGGLRIVGTTTPSGLDLLASTAAEFVARARIFRLWPTDEEGTLELLEDTNRKRDVPWTQAAIEEAVELSSRLVRNRSFPGKAFDVLKEAEAHGDRVGTDEVSRAVVSLTGLTAEIVSRAVPMSREAIARELERAVLDQPEAVDAGTRSLLRLKTGLAPKDGPIASLLFFGRSGVGKTALARALARLAYGSETALLRRDMSEYANHDAADRFLGFGHRSRGLPDAAAVQPFSVVLLDEIEKASMSVIHLLLQLLGEGRLTGSSGITADFRSAIVILTSNIGADVFDKRAAGFGTSERSAPTRAEIQRALATRFPAEFVNRLEVVLFQPLSADAVRLIAKREVQTIADSSAMRRRKIGLSLTNELWERLACEGYDPAFGARPMVRVVQRLVGDALAAALSRDPNLHDVHVVVQVDGAVVVEGGDGMLLDQG
jgi:ATP-dependent Clp protease ATP-binding subunit ClpA